MSAIHSGTREIERSKNRIINGNGILDGPDARNNALCDGFPRIQDYIVKSWDISSGYENIQTRQRFHSHRASFRSS